MAYLIAILVMALVLGPILWLKPSPGQARQAQQRLRARREGLEVRLCSLPQSRRCRVRQETPVQGAVYRLPLLEQPQPPLPDFLWVRENATAAWETETAATAPPAVQAALNQVMAAAPADVVAVEAGSGGASIYWQERGGEEAVATVAGLLRPLRAALSDSAARS